MIRRRADAVVLLRDGFTGVPLPPPAVSAFVDGQRCRLLTKPGGYHIVTDQTPGEHELRLRCPRYRDVTLGFTAGSGRLTELETGMEPGPGYRFPAGAAGVTLRLHAGGSPLAGEGLCAAMAGAAELKIAQNPVENCTKMRVFCRGNALSLPIPGQFLAADEKDSGPETLRVLELDGETLVLDRPMENQHPRGTALLPIRTLKSDGEGTARVVYPAEGKLFLLCRGQWRAIQIRAGEQELEWDIPNS